MRSSGRRFGTGASIASAMPGSPSSTTTRCSRRCPARRDRAHARGVPAPPPRRVGDAAQGLPRRPRHGDFRAMPARGDGLAMLKWISSFPGNPAHGLPAVMGVVVLSDAKTSEPLALLDARSVTALRTGAVAAVAARALASAARGRRDHRLRAARRLGGALPGGRRLGPGVCTTRAPRRAGARRRARLGARDARRGAGLRRRVLRHARLRAGRRRGDLRPGLHLNMLGADGPGKAEATVGAVVACALFCDEWEQASHGGELTGAVEAGLVDARRRDRPRRGPGRRRAAGRPGAERGDAVRLDRPRDPGPRRRRGGLRGLARGARRGDDRRFVTAVERVRQTRLCDHAEAAASGLTRRATAAAGRARRTSRGPTS